MRITDPARSRPRRSRRLTRSRRSGRSACGSLEHREADSVLDDLDPGLDPGHLGTIDRSSRSTSPLIASATQTALASTAMGDDSGTESRWRTSPVAVSRRTSSPASVETQTCSPAPTKYGFRSWSTRERLDRGADERRVRCRAGRSSPAPWSDGICDRIAGDLVGRGRMSSCPAWWCSTARIALSRGQHGLTTPPATIATTAAAHP